jgi:predicted TIM-barrel fold metal-dependent hydrolase
MNKDDMIIISVDDHLIEPPDMFKGHLGKEHLALAPQFLTDANGNDMWVFEDRKVINVGLNAVVGRPKSEYGCEPTSLQHMRAATYDIDKRIQDMNADGIVGSLCFGTFIDFDGGLFVGAKDKTNALRMVKAYNDWHIDEWCGTHPGRMIPMAILPLWDNMACVEEIRRMNKKGCHAISFPDNPTVKGLPSIHNEYWNPVWAVCDELAVIINCHIGTGHAPPHPSMESPISAWITGMPISIANSAADWIHLEALLRHPNLKIALTEGGIGWIPYLLERADFTHGHHGAWTNVEFGGKKPSEVFKEHFITCFIDDQFGLRNYQDIGEDLICYESDYPHSDCVWPRAADVLWDSIQALPDTVINKVTHQNAMREFSFDPISTLGRENCTVGALRQQAAAAGVDTQPASMGGANPHAEAAGKRVTSGDVVKLFMDNSGFSSDDEDEAQSA